MIGSAPTFSVSEFVAAFNQVLDFSFPEAVVVGELSSLRISKNAWVYCDIKDEGASLKCFGSVRVLPGPLEDGMVLEVVGRPYLHPQFGFSLNIVAVKTVGEGTLKRAQEMLQKKLAAEGLFDEGRKRSLPYPPESIALVTSVESAAYGDFMKIINQRWPKLRVDVHNVLVQGAEAPEQIVAAVQRVNAENSEAEALIVIRGGGSADDLAAFDHEQVVRAVAASRIPTLVAIGHERDVSLSELAADVRASTPSNAAEVLVPDIAHEKMVIMRLKSELGVALSDYLDALRRESIAYKDVLNQTMARKLTWERDTLVMHARLLVASDPRLPLQKGYAVARNAHGGVIKTAKLAKETGQFIIEFNDGELKVQSTDNVRGK